MLDVHGEAVAGRDLPRADLASLHGGGREGPAGVRQFLTPAAYPSLRAVQEGLLGLSRHPGRGHDDDDHDHDRPPSRLDEGITQSTPDRAALQQSGDHVTARRAPTIVLQAMAGW